MGMVVDHYSKWFLHLFVDADPESPTYNQPVRFYGPYSGFAVYVGHDDGAPPAEVWTTACVDNGWGTPEFKTPGKQCMGKPLSDYPCMNVEKTHPEVCEPYAAVNPNADGELIKGSYGSFWSPKQADVVV